MKKLALKLASLMLVIMLCMSVAGCYLFVLDKGDIAELPNSNTVTQNVTFTTQDETEREVLSNVDAAAKVNRSVVAIQIDYTTNNAQGTAFGSGVIVEIEQDTLGEGEYYILTCHHVISSCGNITVYVPDPNYRNWGDDDYDENYIFTGVIEDDRKNNVDNEVTLIGGDKDSDVAVLKLNTRNKDVDIVCSNVPIEDYKVTYAENVFAIGNPSGTLPMTYMAGNISYLRRKVSISSVGIMELLQHDVMINHGSSGGGLFNMYGELIGITNAGSDEYPGLNYAIPHDGTDGFINIASQLVGTYGEVENNFGYVSGRWNLGIVVETVQSPVQGSYVKIKSVEKGSNAYNKLVAEDYIVSVKYVDEGGKEVVSDATTQAKFASIVNTLKKLYRQDVENPGKFQIIVYRRGFGELTIEIELKKQFIFCDTGYYN